jgi:hypothetical protein
MMGRGQIEGETLMHRLFRGVGSVLLSAAVLFAAGAASADGYRAYRAQHGYVREAVKDCTKINGRWGYYGNPWCTPSEQARFDRWEASRLVR